MTNSSTTRLHITPFNPALLDAVLGPSVRPAAIDVSFHTIETFPENNYGFVTLPTADAEKIMKKLNGAILKGKKLKVQEARPSKRPSTEEDKESSNSSLVETKPKTASKKRKATENTVEGWELPPERKVKRGWTEPAAAQDKRSRKSDKKDKDGKSKSQRSKYTEDSECLFRTNVPPNRAGIKKPEKKKSKDSKKGKTTDGVVVHEFENTVTHPSFIRSGDGLSAPMDTQFVEGKGWVDRDGNIVEAVPEIKSTKRKREVNRAAPSEKTSHPGEKLPNLERKQTSTTTEASDSESESTSSSGSSSSGSASSGDEEMSDASASENEDTTSSISSSEESSSSEEESDSEEEGDQVKHQPKANLVVETPKNKQSDTTRSAIQKPSPNITISSPSPADVHPLEALFKRPTKQQQQATSKPALEISTQFSFFGGNNDDIEEENDATSKGVLEPHTPFTKQDLQARTVRSAAPTPDTAAPTRFRFFDDAGDSDEEEEGDEGDEDNETYNDYKENGTPVKPVSKAADTPEDAPESNFSKWFWENRGDNNRAWKRRRREAAKEKRQRENRQRGMRGR